MLQTVKTHWRLLLLLVVLFVASTATLVGQVATATTHVNGQAVMPTTTVPIIYVGETVADLDPLLNAAGLHNTDLTGPGLDKVPACQHEGDPTCAVWLVTGLDHAGQRVPVNAHLYIYVRLAAAL